ncbi:MAG: alpha/beta fold hydrolase [Candidatus Binataceae bacterium]
MELKERKVNASGINFHVLEAGDVPLVLCLHGFPDTAHSFRHQMVPLASAGILSAVGLARPPSTLRRLAHETGSITPILEPS